MILIEGEKFKSVARTVSFAVMMSIPFVACEKPVSVGTEPDNTAISTTAEPLQTPTIIPDSTPHKRHESKARINLDRAAATLEANK